MLTSFEELREAYLNSRPEYERIARNSARRIRSALLAKGIQATVSWRAKDLSSLMKKALRLGVDTLDAIPDCAGVRVIVSFKWQASKVEEVIQNLFSDIESQENVGARLGTRELGYIATHFLARVHRRQQGPLRCEIQVQTQAQSAWAMVSHDLIYKPVGRQPDAPIERKLHRSAALVDLFDDEVVATYCAITRDPSYAPGLMLRELENHFWRLTSARFDRELSLLILEIIRPSYTKAQLDSFPELVRSFLDQQEGIIEAIYRAQESDGDPLILQPESIAIFERLHTAPMKLRAVWNKRLEPQLLTSLSEDLGLPI